MKKFKHEKRKWHATEWHSNVRDCEDTEPENKEPEQEYEQPEQDYGSADLPGSIEDACNDLYSDNPSFNWFTTKLVGM